MLDKTRYTVTIRHPDGRTLTLPNARILGTTETKEGDILVSKEWHFAVDAKDVPGGLPPRGPPGPIGIA